jgi:hypothetical protein
MRVSNADVLVSSMQLRSPTWSADLREHGGHLYVKEKQDIVISNYLEAGVPDAVNPADKPVVNDDDTPQQLAESTKLANQVEKLHKEVSGKVSRHRLKQGSAQKRPQKVTIVISFSALSDVHRQLGHASAEEMLRFL